MFIILLEIRNNYLGGIKVATVREHNKKIKLATKKKTIINFKSKVHEELEELIKN